MYIVSTGMVCPVGLNAEAACAAMRAGIAGFEELPFQVEAGEPVKGAVVPNLALETPDDERQIDLLQRAVAECLASDVRSEQSGAAFACYGSVLDQVSSDPTTVMPQ